MASSEDSLTTQIDPGMALLGEAGIGKALANPGMPDSFFSLLEANVGPVLRTRVFLPPSRGSMTLARS